MAETEEMTYFAKFKVDASEFLDGISSMRSEFLTFVSGIASSVAIATVAFDQYTKLVQQYGRMANNLNDLSYATGISTEELQKFHYAATLSGDDMGMVDSMLGRLTLSMGQFSDKTSQASKAFTTLKVDPTGKSASEVFLEIAKAMNKIPDAGTRASIAIDILGRSYKDSLPYMEDYIKNQDKLKDAVTYSPDELQAMSDYKQGLDNLGHSWEVFWGKLFFGKPTPTKESVDSMIALWKNQYGYTDEQIKKAMVDTYGLESLQKIGYYTGDAGAAKSSKVNFDDPYKNMSDNELKLQKLKNTLADYNTKMDDARTKGDKTAFDEAAIGARATQLEIDELSKTTKRTTLDIQQMQIDYQKMTQVTIPDQQRELKSLQDEYGALQDKGSAAAIELKSKIKGLGYDIDANIAKTNEWANKLKTAGASVTAPTTQTYATMFASSLQDNGVGVDYAGYSDLASMDASELQAVVDKAGKGGSKGMAERAQTYLDLMKNKSGSSTSATGTATGAAGTTTATKALSLADQAKVDTGTLSTELTKQADLESVLNEKTKAGWIALEKDALTHNTALNQLSMIRAQKELDYMAACVNFGGANPIVQNKIIMSATGPDWTPPAFTAVTAPTLAAADFSSVELLGASGKKSEESKESTGSGSGETKVAVAVTVKADADLPLSFSQAQAQVVTMKGAGNP